MKETRVERKRKRRRAILRIIFVFLVMLGIFIWAINSKFFKSQIDVQNNEHYTKEELISKLKPLEAKSIILLSKKTIEDSIKELSYIDSIEVKRRLPNKVIVVIKERKPYIQLASGYDFLVIDNNGFLLDKLNSINPELPLIIGLEASNINLGENIISDEEENSYKDLFSDNEIEQIVNKLESISIVESDNIKIITKNSIAVEFGPLYNVKYKLKLLNEILEDIEKKNIPTKMILMNKGEHPILVRDEN